MNGTQVEYEFPELALVPNPAEIVPVPNTAIIERRVPEIVAQAEALAVVDQDSLTAANQFSIAVKRLRREIDDTFDPMIDAAHRAHKIAIEKKQQFVGPVKEAEQLVKGKIGEYLDEQERTRREADRRAWEAEQEKIRIQQEALRKTRESEEKARREAQEAESRAARARSEESRQKALDEAARVRKQAEEDQTKILADAAVKESAIVDEQKSLAPAAAAPQTNGISTRADWDFEVMDAALVPREFLLVDEVKIRKIVKAMKGETSIPGIRIFQKTIVSQRIK